MISCQIKLHTDGLVSNLYLDIYTACTNKAVIFCDKNVYEVGLFIVHFFPENRVSIIHSNQHKFDSTYRFYRARDSTLLDNKFLNFTKGLHTFSPAPQQANNFNLLRRK
jgi:hypothetical protein